MPRFARALSLLLALLLLPFFVSAESAELFAWTLRIGGAGETEPMAMAAHAAGGVLVAGYTNSEDSALGEALGGADGLVLRISPEGALLWSQRMGGSGEDRFTHILPTDDGGCLAMGITTSDDGHARAARGGQDAFLVRLDGEGAILWTKCLGGTADDELLDIRAATSGGYLVVGRSQSYTGDLGANMGGWDAWAMLLSDEDGKPIWVERVGNAGHDRFLTALETEAGFLLVGEVGEGDGQMRPYLMQYDRNGDALWDDPLLLGGTGVSRLTAALKTENGALLLGETNSRSALMPLNRGGMDLWVIALQASGAVAWQRAYGGSQDESALLARALPGGGYVLLGSTQSDDGQVSGAHGAEDAWALRLSAAGVLNWQQTLGGSRDTRAKDLLVLPDGRFLLAGSSLAQDGDIGSHVSVRTGVLALLEANGNLTWARRIGGNEECTLSALALSGDAVYVLGSLRKVTGTSLQVELSIGMLAGDF
ncbi:MAG: hypothetical protein LBN04_10100 [Oscillospiraceae bacterium]|jgi:hypothetical protein|nr:hypothetical protein [Oscillospiraceae bacterium]